MMFQNPQILVRFLKVLTELIERVDGQLAGIRICFVPGLTVAGCTVGNQIWIASQLLDCEPLTLLQVIAHELAHVFQQRAGRAEVTVRLDGVPVCLDKELEEEAEEIGLQVVRGKRVQFSDEAATILRVLQPLVVVGSERRTSLDEFSPRFRQVLNLIQGATPWLESVLPIDAAPFLVPSEEDLLEEIQNGLHGSTTALFPAVGLSVAPALFLTMNEGDFQDLLNSITQSQFSTAGERVLHRQRIRTQKEFADLTQRLKALGIENHMIFDSMTISDRVTLLDGPLGSSPAAPTPLDQAAANFALSTSQSPLEFGAVYSLFLACAGKLAQQDPNAVADRLSKVWTATLPAAVPFLRCLVVPANTGNEAVLGELQRWLQRGNLLGFHTLGAAMFNLLACSGVDLTQDQPDHYRIDQYVTAAQKLISSNLPAIHLGQDGMTRWLRYESPTAQARLLLDNRGSLAFLEFQPAESASST